MLSNQKPLINRICFTHIPVTDVRQSAKWYAQNLGFREELVFDTHAILQPDLHLIRVEGAVSQNIVGGRHAPRAAYYCDDINEMHSYLTDKGINVDAIIEEPGCGRTFEVYDPDGNRITLWQAV
jgi:predicted enzyme related to lactoylglutathione lyase